MSFFKKIFSGSEESGTATSTANQTSSSNEVKFGRYTDCNKNKKQVDFWNQSEAKFKEKAYVDSFEACLNYIRDEYADNVKITRNGDQVDFELIQGSKVVRGSGNSKDFSAECPIILMDNPSIPVMRKLMSINYTLFYSKFALIENRLVMKFTSHAIDAAPTKLYYALKELATKADQQDDLLASEFGSLKSTNNDHVIVLTDQEKEIKHQALISWINETKEEIAKHADPVYMSGGIAFLLLNLTYKIDYLICPQGSLTDSLERIQQMFFAKNDLSTHERNKQIMAEFEKIVAAPKEKIYEGLYEVKSTFAIAPAAVHKNVMDMMSNERTKLGWYKDNNHPAIVEAIYSYMISYAFFNYGMVTPVTDLLNLAMQLMNKNYYEKFGATTKLIDDNKVLNIVNLKLEINRIVSKNSSEYPHAKIDVNLLKFTSMTDFIDSLIVEMDKLNLNKQ